MSYSKILIVGKRCSGKSTLFWNLQKELNWPTFSLSHFLRDFIRTHGLTPEEIEEQSAETSMEVEKRIQALVKTPDHVIIESRMLGFLTAPIPHTCRLLLTCEDTTRIERSAFRERISIDKARGRLFKREKNLFEAMKAVYKRDDFYDETYYDIVINTTHMTPADVLHETISFIQPTI
jgi:cytidylate kinase